MSVCDRTPLARAASFIDKKQRSQAEIVEYLISIGITDTAPIIDRLKDACLLDDKKFAEDFISSRLATKPLSRRALAEQLQKRMIDSQTADEVLERLVCDEVEFENALSCARKYLALYSQKEPWERKNKALERLLYRGFEIDLARRCVSIVSDEEDRF